MFSSFAGARRIDSPLTEPISECLNAQLLQNQLCDQAANPSFCGHNQLRDFTKFHNFTTLSNKKSLLRF